MLVGRHGLCAQGARQRTRSSHPFSVWVIYETFQRPTQQRYACLFRGGSAVPAQYGNGRDATGGECCRAAGEGDGDAPSMRSRSTCCAEAR